MSIAWHHKYFVWINFLWFQIIWLIAVVYHQQAITLLIASLCLHFVLTPTRRSDLFNLFIITLLGSLCDSFLSFLNILIFPEPLLIAFSIPLWLVLLWCHFALTLNHGMGWLVKLPMYAQILFGAVFGTLSYYAGAQIGTVNLHNNLLLSLTALCIAWGLQLPIYITVVKYNRRAEGAKHYR